MANTSKNSTLSNKQRYSEYVLPLESQKDTAQADKGAETAERTIQTDFARLSDGGLLELVEDPSDRNGTLLALWRKNRLIEYVREFTDEVRIFVPQQRNSPLLRSIRLPECALPYESVTVIWDDLEKLISQCIDVQPRYIPVLADFILSTWFVDRFQVAPYLSIVGLPQSGKTTLLKLLSLLCRRSLFIADITKLSLYLACSELAPTVLIDEAATISSNSALRHLLRVGTTRDAIAVRNEQTFHTYGAKVISWLEPPVDLALNSRCIRIAMSETRRTDLRPLIDPRIEKTTETLRGQLLQYRLENYNRISVAGVDGDEILRPRSKDILRSLCAPHFRNPRRSESLLKLLASGEALPQEHLDPEQNAVLRALFSIIHLRKEIPHHALEIDEITNAVNHYLQLASEGLRLQPRRVGAILSALGFSNRRRTNSGYVLRLDPAEFEKIHRLADCYGIHNMSDRTLVVSREECELCQAIAKKNAPIAQRPAEEHVMESIQIMKEPELPRHVERHRPRGRRPSRFRPGVQR